LKNLLRIAVFGDRRLSETTWLDRWTSRIIKVGRLDLQDNMIERQK